MAGFRILRDFGSEGLRLDEREYHSVDEAVKAAMRDAFASPQIVRVVEWEAKETAPSCRQETIRAA